MATTLLNNAVQNVMDAHYVPPLRESVKTSVEKYFTHLDGQHITDLYEMVLSEVEEPLLQTLMRITGGNQSLAAKILGLSRGTLRKKLEQYDLM
jgi:Fis family transcriptional regulator, factor for inversion stimulation protein